jgi:predicted dehydrogenase
MDHGPLSARAIRSTASPPLRVGLVGCGYQGKCLATAAARSTSVSVVACADPDARAAEKVAELAGDASTHPSVEALLGEAAVDAVIVATPHHVLCPVSLKALQAGKHVLAEKPMALNAEEATAVESEAANAGVRFMAGYSCRFSLARYVHDLLSEGVVGELVAMTGAIGSGPFDRGWLTSVGTGGGPLLYLGSHLVDMLLWFAGENPVEVSGRISRLPISGLDETSAFQLVFSSGAEAQCLVTQSASRFFYSIDVYGRAGRVTLRGSDFTDFEVEVESQVVPAYAHPTVVRPSPEGDHITTMLVPELEEFALSVREGRLPAITATDGRWVLQVLDAVVAADRRGGFIKIG